METKHTKGEWIYNPTYETITDSEGYGIAQPHGIRNEEEWEANAKLIAAAPEMLEALIEISQLGSTGEDAREMKKIAINAITKATK